MPRKCTVCAKKKRPEIDRLLVENVATFRNIAAQHGLSVQALLRHRDDHLPARLAKAREAREVANADNLLTRVQALHARALGILDKAESANDLRAATGAIRETRGCLELLGKLAGQLKDAPIINVFMSAEWIEIRGVIIAALDRHPDAQAAVVNALSKVGGDAGGA